MCVGRLGWGWEGGFDRFRSHPIRRVDLHPSHQAPLSSPRDLQVDFFLPFFYDAYSCSNADSGTVPG